MKELMLGIGLLALKGSLVLLVAELLASRTRRASVRHLVWLLAVVALAALPILQVALPALHFPIPITGERAVETQQVPWTLSEVAVPETLPHRAPAGRSNTTTISATARDHAGAAAWIQLVQRVAITTYAAGVGGMALLLLLGEMRLRRRAAAGNPVPGPVRCLADDICRRMGIERRVGVVTSDSCPVPHVVGLLHPVVLLPACSLAWPEGRLRHVLEHELAHVRRADVASGVLGALVRIVYWPHPWVRRAVSNMHREAEHACDDAVLRGGAIAKAYALDLVLLAGTGRMEGPILTPAMSNRSLLPRRVDALLDASRDRRPVCRRAGLIGAMLLVGAAVPLGAAWPGWPDSPTTKMVPAVEMTAIQRGAMRPGVHRPVQARWFDSSSHTAVFVHGPLLLSGPTGAASPGFLLLLSLRAGATLRSMQVLSQPGQPARFVVRQAGALESWSGPGIPWVDEGLAEAAARLPETVGVVWPTWVIPDRGHYGGSTITGLPGISRDPSRNLVQAGWQDGRARIGAFSTGRLTRSEPGSLVLPPDGGWLVVFRFDTVSGRLQVAECSRDEAGGLHVIYSDDGQDRQMEPRDMQWFHQILLDLPLAFFGAPTGGTDS